MLNLTVAASSAFKLVRSTLEYSCLNYLRTIFNVLQLSPQNYARYLYISGTLSRLKIRIYGFFFHMCSSYVTPKLTGRSKGKVLNELFTYTRVQANSRFLVGLDHLEMAEPTPRLSRLNLYFLCLIPE